MRTTTTATNGTRAAVATRTACVLADPRVWAPSLGDALETLGFHVTTWGELNDLFEGARQEKPSLIVLASAEPAAAVRACRVTQDVRETPLMVVMPREGDLIPSLDAGADDAVVARVDSAVFLARVRALLRRIQPSGPSNSTLSIRDLVLDFEKYQVLLEGNQIALTPTEFRLLAVLAQQAGRVVDPRALLSAVHQHDYSERDAQNLVKVHIANLRRKLNDSRSNNPYILCVRGFGYMLERRGRIRPGDPLVELMGDEE